MDKFSSSRGFLVEGLIRPGVRGFEFGGEVGRDTGEEIKRVGGGLKQPLLNIES